MWMTDEQIRTTYRDAKFRAREVGILAQLNACDISVICDILTAGGYKVDTVGKRRRSWSEEREERLIELRKQGMNYAQLARTMGISYEAARWKCHQVEGGGKKKNAAKGAGTPIAAHS